MKRAAAGSVAVMLGLGLAAVAVTSPASANPDTLLNQVPAENAGHDGRAYDVTIVNGIAYVGGDFANGVAYGGGSPKPHKSLAAYTVPGGALVDGFTATTNGIVYAVVTDGANLYIGGDFTQVNGQPAARVAKLKLPAGTLDTTFTASANQPVRGLALRDSRLLMAGWFTQVDGQARKYGAAVNAADGAIDAFDPQANGKAYSIEVAPVTNKVYMGGKFTAIGGAVRKSLAELDPVSGAATGPAVFKGLNGKVLDISFNPNGTQVLGAVDDGQNSAFAWSTAGKKQWSQKADGNVQDVVWVNGNVYFGFHDGFGGANDVRLYAADALSGTLEIAFHPTMNGLKGVLGLATDGSRLVAVGDFSKVSGKNDRGVAIFG